MRRSRAQNQRPLAMAIRDRACAYQRWVQCEHSVPSTVFFDPLVAALGPAEALALAEDEQLIHSFSIKTIQVNEST